MRGGGHSRMDLLRLHRHAVAQQLIGAQIGLVERDAGRFGGGFQLLQGCGDVGGRVAAVAEVLAQEVRLDGAVAFALVPVAEVAVAQAVRSRLVGEQRDHAVLRAAFGTRLLGHSGGPCVSVAWRRLRPASVIRYFCSRLLGLSGKVYSRFWSASSVRMILLSWPETPF